MLEAGEHRGRKQGPDPGCGQFQGERQALKPSADLRDGGTIVAGQREVRFDGLRAAEEQVDRWVRGQEMDRQPVCHIGCRQRRDEVFVFAAESKGRPAGDEHLQLRALGDEIGNQAGRRCDVFEVVQQQQHPAIAQRDGESLRHGQGARLGEAQSLGDGGRDQGGIAQCVQRNPDNAASESGSQVRGDGQGEAGLPDTTRTGQRHHAHVRVTQQVGHRGNIPLPPDQRARRHRKTATMMINGQGRNAPWPGRLRQQSVILRGQLQDLQQSLHRVLVGPVQPAFQVPQSAHAQPGPLGQLLLGQPRHRTVLPE